MLIAWESESAMSIGTVSKYDSFLYNQVRGVNVVNFSLDTIKVALTTATYSPNAATHVYFSNITSQITGTNYAAGGVTLTGITVGLNSGKVTISAANAVWNKAASGGFSTAKYAIIYKDTGTASTSPLIAYVTFDSVINNTLSNCVISWSVDGILAWDVTLPPPPPPPATGMFLWGTRDIPDNSGVAAIAASLHRGEWIRNRVDWTTLDPNQDGDPPFTWGTLDARVNACRTAGIKLCLCFCVSSGHNFPTTGQVAPYAKMCAAIAARYNYPEFGGIEFENEPDSNVISGARVAGLGIAASNAIAAVQATKAPELRFKTFVGAFLAADHLFNPDAWIIDFYNTLNGNDVNIDYVSNHMYHRPNPPEITDGINGRPAIFTQMDMLNSSSVAHGYTGKFAVTEFGWPTDGTGPWLATEYRQAYAQVRQSIMMLSRGRMDVIIQFQLHGENTPTIERGGLGMIRVATDTDDNGNIPGAGTHKPSFVAWQTMGNILDEGYLSMDIISEPTPPSLLPWHYLYHKTGGRYGHVFWVYPENQTGTITLTGLGATVRKTMQNGTQTTVATTGGSLTLNAINNPTYVDVVW